MRHFLHLRKATLDDLNDLQRLYIATIDATCKNDYTPEQLETWKSGVKNEARWVKMLEKQYVQVAEIKNEIAGFASLDRGSYVDFMYVDPGHLRKGVARALWEALQTEAARLEKTVLTSDVSKTARPFFEKQGFEVVHENLKVINGIEIINYHMLFSSNGREQRS